MASGVGRYHHPMRRTVRPDCAVASFGHAHVVRLWRPKRRRRAPVDGVDGRWKAILRAATAERQAEAWARGHGDDGGRRRDGSGDRRTAGGSVGAGRHARSLPAPRRRPAAGRHPLPSSRRTATPKSAPRARPSSVARDSAAGRPDGRTRGAARLERARRRDAPCVGAHRRARRMPKGEDRAETDGRARGDGRARSCADDGPRRRSGHRGSRAPNRTRRSACARGSAASSPSPTRIRVGACGIEMRRDRSSAGLAQRGGEDVRRPADTARTRRSGAVRPSPFGGSAPESDRGARGRGERRRRGPGWRRAPARVRRGPGAAAAVPRSPRRSPWGGSEREGCRERPTNHHRKRHALPSRCL